MKKLELINILLKERHKQEQSMGYHVTVLESQFASLDSIEAEFDDSKTVRIHIHVERPQRIRSFNNLGAGMKNDTSIWRQVSSLCVDEGRRLDDKIPNTGRYRSNNCSEYLDQVSGRVQKSNNASSWSERSCFYCNKIKHMMKSCQTRKQK